MQYAFVSLMEPMRYYPVFLDLHGRPCVVIGGGTIAEGKVEGLLAAGATVTVVSPTLTPLLQSLVDVGAITYNAREYETGDAVGAFLTVSATDEKHINAQVWSEANAHRQLVNVVDDVPFCNFIAASLVRRGDLTIAISTSGNAPALAVRLREWLEGEIGNEYAHFLELAGTIRAPLARKFPAFAERKRRWYDLVDSDVLELLRHGDEATAHHRIEEIMGVAPVTARGTQAAETTTEY
jgi:precorrin-2 dehydrogenase/sirohydrochlorin ferrochelatase